MIDIKHKIVNTKIAQELFNELMKFDNDEETVLCKMHDLETDSQKKELLDYILNNNVDWDDIVVKVWEISGYVNCTPVDMFGDLDPNKEIYDYDELRLKFKPNFYN